MKIALGCDHAGYRLKTELKAWLEESHEILDLGTYTADSVDYPDFAHLVGKAVSEGQAEKGILVCGSGIGVCMAANKVPGVRAARCHDTLSAELSRQHNDANVLTLGERLITFTVAQQVAEIWLNTDFEGGRHQRRVDKIPQYE